MCASVSFGGSRSLGAAGVSVARLVSSALLARGVSVSVGCAPGADAVCVSVFVSAGAAARVRLFAVGGPAGGFPRPGVPAWVRGAVSAGCSVAWWAGGGPAVPLAARLAARSRACVGSGVSAAVFVVSSPRSRGSFGAAAAAARGGVPVFVVAVGSFALPSLGRGRWVLSSAGAVALGVAGVSGARVWRWVAARPSSPDSETVAVTPKPKRKSAATRNRLHIVWCPKYRQPVLNDEIAKTVELHIRRAADNDNIHILALNIQPDHVHLVAQIPPNINLSRAVMHMKGVSSYYVRKNFPEIKKLTGPNHLWAKRYFAVSVGSSAMKAVKSYVNNQSGE